MPALATTKTWLIRHSRLFNTALSLSLFTLALWLVHRELDSYHINDLSDVVFGFAPATLLQAAALAAIGYLLLTGYDFLALRWIGKPLPTRQVMLAAFTGFAVSNSVGHALLSGGSMRYRFYSSWGLNGIDIARVVLCSTLTYFIGSGTLLLLCFLLPSTHDMTLRDAGSMPISLIVAVVGILLATYWVVVLARNTPIRLRDTEISLPGPRLTLLQQMLGSADLMLAALVLYVLLSARIDIPLPLFLGAYMLAQWLGLFSQVPGGLGVFEASFLFLLAPQYPAAELTGALVVYRIIYYWLPLLVAGAVLLAYEIRQHNVLQHRITQVPLMVLRHGIPQVFSALLVLAGTVLLFSGTLPGEPERLEWLNEMLPLPVMEISHLAGSVIGLLLLGLSRAVRLRLNSAYQATVVLLLAGIAVSLAKGFDYEEAFILAMMLALFLPTRQYFYRRASLWRMDFSAQWLLLIVMTAGCAIWLGFFSYRHVEYAHELWWQFSIDGDASRFLRSSVAIVTLALGFLCYRLMTTVHVRTHAPDNAELARAAAVVASSNDTQHFLALTGDKSLLWSRSGSGVLTYDVAGRYWIAMGDPAGSSEEQEELVWRFREEADHVGSKIAFYQVGVACLPLYLDLGLSLIKLGEEARVALTDFSLEGRRRAGLRQQHRKIEREGCSFRMLDATGVAAHMDELQAVSAAWLENKKAREKRFSLGYFDRDYLLRTPVAVAERNGVIVAFANIWTLDNHEEISIDLMRYSDDAPSGVIEYLTVCLMLWGKQRGDKWFNLGMAPLSGLETHPLAPVWHKVGNTVFRFGNEFYNFKGLHQYKEKFDPVWTSRYLAAPAGLDLPTVLINVTTLIAGGVKGVFTK
jgi:phosphatidylglycerol lysyltransferase